MEDNNKLFVFEKKEVALIFFFIVMISAISFTMGVRVGKNLHLEQNYSNETIEKVKLESIEEESVNSIVNEAESDSVIDDNIISEQKDRDIEERLKAEMAKLAQSGAKMPMKAEPSNQEDTIAQKPAHIKPQAVAQDVYNQNKDFRGKFTIQLSSHNSEREAKDFADAFILQGYDMIINEAAVDGKGVMYRVSIGIFDSKDEALRYLEKEKSLFRDQDYFINKF